MWPEICSTPETCIGRKCQDRDDCFVLKMRAKAADADLMVVNHHLLMSDLAVRESGFGEVIPRYEALIVDEAHGLEDAATQHFGFHMSHFRIVRLVRDVRSELSEAGVDPEKFQKPLAWVDENGRRLFACFGGFNGQRAKLVSVDPETAEIRDLLCSNLEVLASMLTNVPHPSEELKAVASRAFDISLELRTILDSEPSGEYACWAERRDRTLFLHASPVEISSFMKARLYQKIPQSCSRRPHCRPGVISSTSSHDLAWTKNLSHLRRFWIHPLIMPARPCCIFRATFLSPIPISSQTHSCLYSRICSCGRPAGHLCCSRHIEIWKSCIGT